MNEIISQTLKKVDKILKPQPCVYFDVLNQKTDILDNKIGGIPYFPKNMKYPISETTGKPLVLLAQLNFDKIPHIKNFPKTGILQFFIGDNDFYGADLDHLDSQKNFRIIYHPNTTESNIITENPYTDIDYLPFTGEYILSPSEPDIMLADMQDYRFDSIFVQIYNKLSKKPISSIMDFKDDVAKQLWDRNNKEEHNAWIGGYSFFTQTDPREYKKQFKEFTTILFECNSCFNENIDIMWGDSGVGVFMIPPEKLKKLEFSQVIYNYDCY